MRPFSRAGAVRDSVAGIELAAMSIPQALGYAAIAGMPAVSGFYTLFLPLLAFATFGSSGYLVVAADSATAAILAGGISPLAPLGSAKYVALAGMVAMPLTAGFLLVARLLQTGFPSPTSFHEPSWSASSREWGFRSGSPCWVKCLGLRFTLTGRLCSWLRSPAVCPASTCRQWALAALVIAVVLVLDRFAPRVPGPLIGGGRRDRGQRGVEFRRAWNRNYRALIAGGLPPLSVCRTSTGATSIR